MDFCNLSPSPRRDLSFQSTSTPEKTRFKPAERLLTPIQWTFWGLLPVNVNAVSGKYKCLLKPTKGVRFAREPANTRLKQWRQFKRAKHAGFKQWCSSCTLSS